MPVLRGPLADRFYPKVDRSGGPDACHPWKGAKSKKRARGRSTTTNYRGHLRVWDQARGWIWVYAHVVALALATDGEFIKYDQTTGERLEVCHRCGARWGDCCNEKHLYWGTKAQNRADRYRSAQSPVSDVRARVRVPGVEV